ncbi:N-acetylmuramoyl-L-alanine amidase [Robertmurraya massiliosenegalensis]|uniref:N-acetylmuramoyl-L-alanine amidase n=1 Tax=Robertmurraya TaxID=2837507 RepID=UPI0039A64405
MKIMLDAGHGYNTPGKRSPDGMREYEFNRVVAKETKAILETYKDVTVYFSHSDTKDVSLQERTDKANRLAVDCFVSIHANAYGTGWNDVSGIETYVYTSKPKVATELASKVQKNLVVATGLRDRGVKTANFHVLRATKMTAILVECGFMTNQADLKLLLSSVYRKTCAEAIVKGLREQFGLTLMASSAPVPVQTAAQYKVVAGPFQEKKTADKLLKKLKDEGFPVSIVSER